jgi:hypothetical protein
MRACKSSSCKWLAVIVGVAALAVIVAFLAQGGRPQPVSPPAKAGAQQPDPHRFDVFNCKTDMDCVATAHGCALKTFIKGTPDPEKCTCRQGPRVSSCVVKQAGGKQPRR